jgi:hypothetical protein
MFKHLQIAPLLFALLPACGGGSGIDSSGTSSSGDSGGTVSNSPSFTPGGDLIVNEDAAVTQTAWATKIQNGALFSLTPDDPSLFLVPPTVSGFGGLAFILAENKSGSTEVAIILQNEEGVSTPPASFLITVNPVNDPPSFDVGPDISVEASSGSHPPVSGWATNLSPGAEDELGQSLTFVIESNSAPELFDTPSLRVLPDGELQLNLAAGAVGEATITLSLTDDGGTSGLGADNSSGVESFILSVSDSIPPSVEILYPPEGSITDAATITVFGRAADTVGVSFLRVNGAPATSTDGYETWAREGVPLSLNAVLTTQVSDTSDNYESNADAVTVSGGGPLPLFPTALAYDSSGGRLIYFSSTYKALLSYYPSTGQILTFSEPSDGVSWDISALVYSSSPPGLFALEENSKCVIKFDLASGQSSLVSGAGRGEGPVFTQPKGLAFVYSTPGFPPSLAVSDRDFGEEGSEAIVEISLASGDRSIVSSSVLGDASAGRGVGPEMIAVSGLLYQKALSRFLLIDSQTRALLAVDRISGDREVLIDNSDAIDGSSMFAPSEVILSFNGLTAWILDPSGKKVFIAHLGNSTLALLSSNGSQSGFDGYRWSSPRHFTRAGNGDLYVADNTGHAIYSVSTSSGSRTAELDVCAGAGPGWETPVSLAVDELQGIAYVSCEAKDAIYSVSLQNGERTLVTGDGAGTGLALVGLVDVAVLDANTLVAVDVGAGQPRIIKVGRLGGSRNLVSGQGVGGGVSFNSASSLTVDAGTNSAYVLDYQDTTITRVDLSTGDRFRIADAGVGTGPPLQDPVSISWNESISRLLVLQPGALLSINPVLLNREVLCDLDGVSLSVDGSSKVTSPLNSDFALVSSSAPLSVVQISTLSGSAITLSNLGATQGPQIEDIVGLGRSSSRGVLYLLSSSLGALHAVNTAANEQVLLSRE